MYFHEITHLKLAHVRSASHAELKSSAVLANDLSRMIASGGGSLPPTPLSSPPTALSSEEDLFPSSHIFLSEEENRSRKNKKERRYVF